MTDSTRRFSNRVANYVKYRPRYPSEVLQPLKKDCGLTANSIIADVGSGTGFLAELFLTNGNRVCGIEPNKEMREAGEKLLNSNRNFTSIEGTAEATTLPDHSVDFVVAGQAFHWFNRTSCRAEFSRILRPGGWIVLIWNDRRTDSTPFLVEYEQLLRTHATDYRQVDHKQIDVAVMREFFGVEPALRTLPNFQHFDFEALRGRLLSSSYVPEAGQPGYPKMMEEAQRLYEAHATDGEVVFEYDTVMYYGRLKT